MSFYAAYNIQADFPGADVHYDTLEVYGDEKSFLLALKNYIRYARMLALENDLDRFRDEDWEEAYFREYVSLIEKKLSDDSVSWPLDLRDFKAYDIQLSISKATSDPDSFVQFVCSYLSEISESDDFTDFYDDEEVEMDEVESDVDDTEDSQVDDEEHSDDLPLMTYCCQITASGNKPDEMLLAELMCNYMANVNSEAFSLVDTPDIEDAKEAELEEIVRKRAID